MRFRPWMLLVPLIAVLVGGCGAKPTTPPPAGGPFAAFTEQRTTQQAAVKPSACPEVGPGPAENWSGFVVGREPKTPAKLAKMIRDKDPKLKVNGDCLAELITEQTGYRVDGGGHLIELLESGAVTVTPCKDQYLKGLHLARIAANGQINYDAPRTHCYPDEGLYVLAAGDKTYLLGPDTCLNMFGSHGGNRVLPGVPKPEEQADSGPARLPEPTDLTGRKRMALAEAIALDQARKAKP